MSDADRCRLCAVLPDPKNSHKLFDRSRRKLLLQIEELTGLQLKNTKHLPEHICKSCEEQTLQAHEYRERCIRVQQQFTSLLKKQKKQRLKKKPTEQVPEIEKVILDEALLVKQEELEDVQTFLSPILEVSIKSEPTNAIDISSNSFNPLADNDYRLKLTEDDKQDVQLNIEKEENVMKLEKPQINRFSIEEPIRTKRKYKERKQCDPDAPKIEEEPKKERIPKEKREPKQKQICICDQCGISFASPFNLEIHQRRHVGDKQFQCTICPEKCYTKWSLDRHIRRHTGELPFQCRYCDRRFIDHYPRIRHERSHTKVRPFACTQCEKTFSVADTLKNHMLTHTGNRTFHCKVCDRMFLRRTHLITHYRSITHQQNEAKLQQSNKNEGSFAPQQLVLPLAI